MPPKASLCITSLWPPKHPKKMNFLRMSWMAIFAYKNICRWSSVCFVIFHLINLDKSAIYMFSKKSIKKSFHLFMKHLVFNSISSFLFITVSQQDCECQVSDLYFASLTIVTQTHTHCWHLQRSAATMNIQTHTHIAADIWSLQWLSQHFTLQKGKDRSVGSLFTDSSANSSCHNGQWSHYSHLAVHTIKLLMFLFFCHCRTCLKRSHWISA